MGHTRGLKRLKRLRMICLLGILISDIWFLTSVNAGMIVYDPTSFHQMAQMITNATRTINEMRSIKTQMQQMKMLLGNPGALRQALNLDFLNQKSDAIGTLNQVNLFTSQMPDPTNLQSMRYYAQSRLFLPDTPILTAAVQK